ncbi:ubiquitin carboxyl-terminal hydrolase 17-like protein 6 [Pteronotus mesoamericanus]|uniref:ubiquitin carboxyl-terminal hydrolase 17-like protein 6 n=1 Tax=Pteronotus mesoamericanus TaxID=1884717 RepID=UPI0023EB612F|nr:ubiquitin carboxyl-terminal hydrolase 17-like protein 6 [Pteronotus parnellii mesoamericanus]
METVSPGQKDESQLNVTPTRDRARSSTGGAEAHCGGSCRLEEPPLPPSQTVRTLHDGLAPTRDRSSWKRRPGVGAGLRNLGNTCYVNAALQCLTHTPPLARYLLSRRHSETCPRLAPCVLCAMQVHVARALLRPADALQPPEELLSGFHRHRQEDAHEYLMFTVNAMQQACLRECEQLAGPSPDATLIRQIFGGYWRSQIKCLHCHSVSDTLDPYLDIALDIQGAQSVTQALELLVTPEKLDGDNSYQCSVCLKKVPASKTLTLHTASKVLILALKRFSDFTGRKMEKDVHYPEHLDVGPYLSQLNTGPLVYELYAVLVHTGWTCHNGHYFCYVKAADSQWFTMNDTKVTACDASSALCQRAYVLFYIQKSDLERDGGSASIGLGTEPKVLGSTQRRPGSHSNITGLELEGPTQDTSVKHISLEQWKLLQEQSRPMPAFNVRKVSGALPADAIVIHPSKYGGGVTKLPPGQENCLLNKAPAGKAKAGKRRKKGPRALRMSL